MNFFDDDIDFKNPYEKDRTVQFADGKIPFLDQVPDVTTQNIVYSCKMGSVLNLNYLLKAFRRWLPQLNIKKFPALCIRFRTRLTESKIAFLIFENGKIICTGVKTPYHALYLMQNVLLPEFKRVGYVNITKVQSFSVHNLVAHTMLPFSLDLRRLADDYVCCNYEPEVFPSAHFKHPSIKPTGMMLFSTGQVIISGVTKLEEANEKFRLMYPIFCQYQMEKEAPKIKHTEKQKVMDQIYVKSSASVVKKLPSFLARPENQKRDAIFAVKREPQNIYNNMVKQESTTVKTEPSIKKEAKIKKEIVDEEDEIGFGENFGVPNRASWA
jgi:TATA-box binding protein (TBP) (component of TFIID and TFIIIB)